MRSAALVFFALAPLAGCASSWGDLGGTVLGESMEKPGGVYFGGTTLLIVDRALGCQNLGWVDDRYVETDPPDAGDFTAIQIELDVPLDADAIGTFELDSSGGTDTWGLQMRGGELTVDHARSGELVIESINAVEAEGTISLAFADDGVGGRWHAEQCRGLTIE